MPAPSKSPGKHKRHKKAAPVNLKEKLKKSAVASATSKVAAMKKGAGIIELFGLEVNTTGSPSGRRVKDVLTEAAKQRDKLIAEERVKAMTAAASPVTGNGHMANDQAQVVSAAARSEVRVPEVLPPATTVSKSALHLNRQLRRKRALELRIAGHDYRSIVEQLKMEGFTLYPSGKPVGLKTVYYDVQESLVFLGRHEAVLAEEVRNLELQRLDWMQEKLWRFANIGDAYSIITILQIMKVRAQILGNIYPKDPNGETKIARQLKDVSDDELRNRILQKAADLNIEVPAGLLPPAAPDPNAGPSNT